MSNDFRSFGIRKLQEICKNMVITIPLNVFYLTSLPCKILIAMLVMLFTANKRHCFILAISSTIFIQIFTIFEKHTLRLLLTFFVIADVGKQLNVPNATAADDASM